MEQNLRVYYNALLAAGGKYHPSIGEARRDLERAQRAVVTAV